jgi:hypothetical protein
MSTSDTNVEHSRLQLHGFVLADATATGERAHDDLIWIACGGEGRWLSPKEAIELAQGITTVVASHLERHALAELDAPSPWGPRPQVTPTQALLNRACGHLSTGYRLTCLAAPQYSAEGRDELMKAQELLIDLARLLKLG